MNLAKVKSTVIAATFAFYSTLACARGAGEWRDYGGDGGGSSFIFGFLLLGCIVAVLAVWKQSTSSQRTSGVIGAIIGAFAGSGMGIAGSGGAVNGIWIIATLGFFIGRIFGTPESSDQ